MKKVAMVISASPDHNRSNVNKTPAQSLEELSATIDAYPHLHIKLDLATAFGCPFRGEVSMEEITFVLDGAVRAGIRDICLCDTIGVGMPEQVRHIFEILQERYAQEPGAVVGSSAQYQRHGHGQYSGGDGGRYHTV